MVLGGALAVLPAFAWYSAPRAGGPVRATGFAGAGQLLLMPVIGVLAVIAGAAIVSARRESRTAGPWTGVLAAVAGALALGFAVWAASAPRVRLEAELPGGTEVVPAAVDVEPAAVVTVVVALALLGLGAMVTWAGRRR
jgi:hypothetical protein